MKTSDSIAIATVSLFEAVNCPFMLNRLTAPQIFVSKASKILVLASASPCNLFSIIYQKLDWRKMDEFYDYTT